MTLKRHKAVRLLLLAAVCIFLLIVQSLALHAESIPAEQVQISTPVYVPSNTFNPTLGHYSYSVSWNGIPAGSVELELNRSADDFEIRTSARTAKIIDLLYKLRYNAETVLFADTLMPKHSFSVTQTNSKKKKTEVEFLPDGEIQSVSEDHRGRVKTLKFDPDNFTLDPYSAGFLALSQEWKVGDSRQFDLFSGKSRYLIEFTAVELTELTVNGKVRTAIVLSPSVQKLTDTGADTKEKKMREARIYISTDQSREILKISSDLMIGSVDTELIGFSPTPQPASKPGTRDKIAAIGLKLLPVSLTLNTGNFHPLSTTRIRMYHPLLQSR